MTWWRQWYRSDKSAVLMVLGIASVRVLLWAALANQYGIFRDELYYLACAEHLDWGYVDQPPLIALVTWLVRHTLGTSLHALRLLPALAGALTIVLAATLARQLGGGRAAQVLAAVATLCSPILLGMTHLLTMNAWEPLSWLACACIVVHVIQSNQTSAWLWWGLILGVGLQNKYSIAFMAAGTGLGLLLTGHRKMLKGPWVWCVGVLALLSFLPNLVWQARHDFPFLALMENIRHSGRDVVLAPVDFMVQQVLINHPANAVLWVAGLVWLFKGGRRYAVLGWIFISVFGLLLLLKGKNYYVSPVYPMMFAAGAVAVEHWARTRAWIITAHASVLVATTVVLSPMILPVLSPSNYITWSQTLGISPPATENQRTGPLPQLYADMHGWKEMAEATARAFHALPQPLRERTTIFARGYGQGGAIDLFGPALGLPKVIGIHQNYWMWGPRNANGESLLVLGGTTADLERWCQRVDVVGRVEHPLSRRDEHFDILHCQHLKEDIHAIWPRVRLWN